MKTYYPESLYELHTGPWRPDPWTIYWTTPCGRVAIPEWVGDVYHWDRWNQKGSIKKQRRKAKFVRTHITKKGYVRTVGPLVHQLVARAWIPNPNNKPQVNHIDGNKTNNHIYNLEWVDNSENVKHSYNIGLQPHRERDTNGRIKRKNH